jgi:hypothetical protein
VRWRHAYTDFPVIKQARKHVEKRREYHHAPQSFVIKQVVVAEAGGGGNMLKHANCFGHPAANKEFPCCALGH